MKSLNYHHLLYFHTVMVEGTVAGAADVLDLAPQTVSVQVRALEKRVGACLFKRQGRSLAPTDTARLMFRYTEKMFATGRELVQALDGSTGRVRSLRVGIVDALPKFLSCRMLMPLMVQGTRLDCVEADLDTLLGELAVRRIDVILSDRPVPTGIGVRAVSHSLGSSPVAFFGTQALLDKLGGHFPAALDNAPVLLPRTTNTIRRSLDNWFDEIGVTPDVLGEFDDRGLMKSFGGAGVGLFPAPILFSSELSETYGISPMGVAEGVSESIVAIVPERRARHAAVDGLVNTAQAAIELAATAEQLASRKWCAIPAWKGAEPQQTAVSDTTGRTGTSPQFDHSVASHTDS